jgi:hypothetical protein
MTLTTRIEAAEVPTRELFRQAFDALNPVSMCWDAGEGEAYTNRKVRFDRMLDAEAWTSAAEMLVPEGWEWTLTEAGHCEMTRDRQRGPIVEGNAAHPSLALLSAILRAERNPR